MTRTVSPAEASVLERLELDRPELVTTSDLKRLLGEAGVGTAPALFAARLRAKGWFLPTERRGVWEFAPAAVAGPFSAHDPLRALKAFLAANPEAACALTFQAAAWANGLADRIPARPEVAASTAALRRRLPGSLDSSVFLPALATESLRGVPVLALESVITHMCVRPGAVRSWASAEEWLPALCAELHVEPLLRELADRPGSVRARAGYLLSGMRPDVSRAIRGLHVPGGTTWFGSRGKLVRHDNTWQIADTLLPFDPRDMETAR
ncbi:MAG: type IV toxin-antitoxin system AbiEi family antitoxin [Propionibacteriaceae bacterium]|jgi:hypothetical protein|nr:type IV toxin-antitoxin system AbiEi family antitoxin [Propionibacteriaceae bacterium]